MLNYPIFRFKPLLFEIDGLESITRSKKDLSGCWHLTVIVFHPAQVPENLSMHLLLQQLSSSPQDGVTHMQKNNNNINNKKTMEEEVEAHLLCFNSFSEE